MKAKYYSVIFSTVRSQLEDLKYHEFSDQMLALVQCAEGFLGMESYRENSGRGVTISYWETLEAIKEWKKTPNTLWHKNMGKR